MGPRLLWCALLHASGVCLSFQVQHLVDSWGDAHSELVTRNDLGLHFLGTPLVHLPWLPDFLLAVHAPLLLMGLFYESAQHAGDDTAAVASSTKTKHTGHTRPHSTRILGCITARWRGRLSVFLLCHAVIMYMRISTIVSTVSLRSHRCARGKENPLELLNGNCHDMMFSGHASVQFLCALFTVRSELPLALRLASLALGVFGAIANILVGDHYTVDIVVAGWFCVLVSTLIRGHFSAVFASHRELHPHPHSQAHASPLPLPDRADPKHEAKLKDCCCECHSGRGHAPSQSLRHRGHLPAEKDASALKYDPQWEVSE